MTGAADSAMAQLGVRFVAGAPIDGAAITLGISDPAREIVWASDHDARAVAELQYSLGDGPARSALSEHRPALLPDVSSGGPTNRWPIFAAQAAELPVGAVFTFPLQFGAITIGLCDTYRREPGLPNSAELAVLLRGVDQLAVTLLAPDVGDSSGVGTAWLGGHGNARAVVHQATGMVAVQLGVGMVEAFARLRAHAYAEGHDIQKTSRDIVARRLQLEADRR